MQVEMLVLAGSAGALDSVGPLLRALPLPLPWPVLVVLHRGRHTVADSGLADLLSALSGRPVAEVDDRSGWPADTVLLAPQGYDTLVGRDGPVLVEPTSAGRSTPSLDEAFDSAADTFGAAAMIVGLSCASTDGLAGARRVLAQGGTVWTLHPADAPFPMLARELAALPDASAIHAEDLADRLAALGGSG